MLMPRVLQQKFGVLPAHTTGGSSLTAAAALASLTAITAIITAAITAITAAAFTAAITAFTAAITAAASLDGSETKFGWEPPHLRRRG